MESLILLLIRLYISGILPTLFLKRNASVLSSIFLVSVVTGPDYGQIKISGLGVPEKMDAKMGSKRLQKGFVSFKDECS